MKKIYYFAMAVLGTVAMVSCVKEIEENNTLVPGGKNTVTFTVSSGVGTRAGDAGEAVTRGVTIPLGKVGDGPSLCLEETVIEMDAVAPITRGTPAYTENAGVLYANNMAVYSPDGTFGDETFENMDNGQIASGGWRYYHTYAADPWPSGDAHFYLRMPAEMTGVTLGDDAYTTPGQITFSYTSPKTAAAQQDILFAYTAMDKDTYKNNYSTNGMPVLFNHALTGVKFAIGNDESEIDYSEESTKIAITEISFKGLKDHGTCVITPASSGTHVSATAAVWNTLSTTLDSLCSGTYADTVMFKAGESFGENGGTVPESFAAAGNRKNLNDAAGTQTFWLIPQTINANVRLRIKYTYGGKEYSGFLDFGEALAEATTNAIEWKAGQLRTYTIRVDEVNVKIADKVAATATPNTTLVSLETGQPILDEDGHEIKFTAYGGTKSDVTIENTGNTKAYIRAGLIGQWLDNEGNPVFGFTDYTAGKVMLVGSWYQDQFVSKKGKHGYFVGLPGYKNLNKNTEYDNPSNNWYLHDDGYYYYLTAVDPGKIIGTAPEGATNASDYLGNPIFTSYTVDKNPAVVVAGAVKEVYFILEIATQAVSAKKSDGSDATLSEAWSKAGVTISAPTSTSTSD